MAISDDHCLYLYTLLVMRIILKKYYNHFLNRVMNNSILLSCVITKKISSSVAGCF